MPAGLSDITAIAAGKSHSLGLRADGTVVAWGHNDKGQTDVPSGLAGVTAIAAGMAHNLALRSDGSVVAWGFSDVGQGSVPYGLPGVRAIAAGWWHSLALHEDGSVSAWGHPDSDQRHVPSWLRGASSIAAGFENSSALIDGQVMEWGNDIHLMEAPVLSEVVAVAYGYRHRLALRKNGTVVPHGRFFGGIQVPEDLADVVAIAGGAAGSSSRFLALRRDGRVVGLGSPGIRDALLDNIPEELAC